MKYEELIILLPCHSLEDFPVHHEGDNAQGLLAGWSALWHPALLAAAGKKPSWQRVESPPEELNNRLLVLPTVCQDQIPTGFVQRAKESGACLIRKQLDRGAIVSQALEQLDGGDGGVDAELAADFLALGYCYLQVELLTRQMRYASNLDEVHFNNQVVAGAEAAMRGELDLAREKLTACFDVLAEERNHYYPVDAFLLDLTLVADTTIGPALRQELTSPAPINLLLAGEVLETMATKEPQSLDALRQAVAENRVGLLGGELTERRLPLLSLESILADLRRGRAAFQTTLGRAPLVYGRRRYGLTPVLPQVLRKLGFRGVLHATLDEGRFPEGIQIKTRWEGSGGSAIDALARAPLDATKPASFLNLAVKMGQSMDTDHVATVCLAHWPGQSSSWFDDLRRIARYGSALGKFVTVDQYFAETDSAGQADRFTADQYRSPYLKQAIIRRHDDPISTSVRYWRRRAAADAVQSLTTLCCLVRGKTGATADELLDEVDCSADTADVPGLDVQIDRAVTSAVADFAQCLPQRKAPEQAGYLVVNPCSFVRRVGIETPELEQLPEVNKPIYAADESHGRKHVVVDVPPMGFVWVTGGPASSKSRRGAKPLAEECLLRNEFFEVLLDPTTGSLRSMHEYKARGNRMSQQLGLRTPTKREKSADSADDPNEGAVYSVMAADSIEITASNESLGEIVAKGRLLDRKGTTQAKFQQTYQLWRGSRVLRIEIELDPLEEPRADPWNSYYAARFAWADESADIWRSVSQTRQAVSQKRIEAPHYIELETEKTRTAILTGGLPFHHRRGPRTLDSLLITRGERARKFQLGIGIELSHPMHEAISLMCPPPVLPRISPPPAPADSSWLFHLDARNVIATYWSPIVDDGAVAGYRVRLLETSGRSARVSLSSFRDVARARMVDFQGAPLGDCALENGKVKLELEPHEWIELEARW